MTYSPKLTPAPAVERFKVQWNGTPMSDGDRQAVLAAPGFGKIFTDHMVVIKWSVQGGWGEPQIVPRAPFLIDPAASVLHYAQEIFEGLKAYRSASDELLLFRPEQNARRFAASAKRMAMAELPEELFIEGVKALTAIDHAWVPAAPGSLYLRPFMFASEAFLGVRPSNEYTFCIIASPAGDYFGADASALRIWIETKDSRAAPGGTGSAKCGGNYAAGLSAQAAAVANNCQQVCYLDAVDHRWIEELGGMNVAFVMSDGAIVTPPLSGTILPGITRDSLFTLARATGLSIDERPYSFTELQDDAASGRLAECFACGTAAVVAPIGEMRHSGGTFLIGDGKPGPITQTLRNQLVDIQTGRADDKFGWVHVIQPWDQDVQEGRR